MKNLRVLSCSFIIFLLFGASQGNAQTFAFIQNEDGAMGEGQVAPYKNALTRQIFEKLIQGRGDLRQQPPELVMKKGEQYVAWMDAGKVQIGLEEKAYDICTSFGADSINALAALLSHELIHYYEKHDWSRHFAMENENLAAAEKISQLEEGLKLEAQADYLGGFLAFSVGYNPYGIMPRLLPLIYQSYGLPEAIPGYPSLSERVAMAERANDRLGELLMVFETAQLLSLSGAYEEAGTYYRYLLRDFQSREIYNNAGVNLVLAALPLFEAGEMPFLLPLELDAETRLRAATRAPDQAAKQRREKLLHDALDLFDRSIRLDEDYPPAYLNTACVYLLLDDPDEARYWLHKGLRKKPEPKAESDFQTLRGIAAALENDKEEAKKWLERARGSGNSLAGANLDILEGKSRTAAPEVLGFIKGMEKIDDLLLSDYLANPVTTRQIKINDNVSCGMHELDHSRIFVHYQEKEERFIVFHCTADNYPAATRAGTRLRDTESNIIERYGTPHRVIGQPAGAVMVYYYAPDRCLLFRLDAANRLIGWCVSQKNLP